MMVNNYKIAFKQRNISLGAYTKMGEAVTEISEVSLLNTPLMRWRSVTSTEEEGRRQEDVQRFFKCAISINTGQCVELTIICV